MLLLDANVAKVPIPAGMVKALTSSLQGAVGRAVTTNPDESMALRERLRPRSDRCSACTRARPGRQARGRGPAPSYEVRYDLPFTERVFLLRAMLEAGETGDRTNVLYADLLSSVRIENDWAFVQEGWSFDDWPGLSYLDGGPANEVVNTGELLSLLTRTDPSNAITAQLARFLVQARSQGTWGNTLESGVVLHGLLDMAATEGNPKLRANVALGTLQLLLDQQFSGPSLDVETKVTAVDAARSAGSELKVSADGTGTLHWSARPRYAVPPARMQAGRPGLDHRAVVLQYVPSSARARPWPRPPTRRSTTAPKATTKKATTTEQRAAGVGVHDVRSG